MSKKKPEQMLMQAAELYAEGEYDAGLMVAAATLGELEACGATSSTLVARAFYAVGQGHHSLGRASQAAGFVDRSLEIWDQVSAAERDAGEVGNALHTRAILHLEDGRLDDAMRLLNTAASSLEANAGEHLVSFCAVLLTLAEVTLVTGNPDEAVLLLERVLEDVAGTEPQSEEHATALNALTAKAMLGLGSAAARRSDHEVAKDLLSRAVEFFDAAFGHGHPEMIAALNEVAAIYRVLGDERAAAAIDEELAVAERMLREAEASALDLN